MSPPQADPQSSNCACSCRTQTKPGSGCRESMRPYGRQPQVDEANMAPSAMFVSPRLEAPDKCPPTSGKLSLSGANHPTDSFLQSHAQRFAFRWVRRPYFLTLRITGAGQRCTNETDAQSRARCMRFVRRSSYQYVSRCLHNRTSPINNAIAPTITPAIPNV